MLSDPEWKSLCDVERQLLAEDPEFARHFEARQTHLSGQPRKRGVRIALIVGLLLTVTMLVAGSASGALAFAAATSVVWLAWRYFDETGRRAT